MSGDYYRSFFTLKEDTPGYSAAGRTPQGRCVVEARGGAGRVSVYVQDLKPLLQYKLYLIQSNETASVGVCLGAVEVDNRLRGEARFDCARMDVGSSGFPIEKFNAVAIVHKDGAISTPLVSGDINARLLARVFAPDSVPESAPQDLPEPSFAPEHIATDSITTLDTHPIIKPLGIGADFSRGARQTSELNNAPGEKDREDQRNLELDEHESIAEPEPLPMMGTKTAPVRDESAAPLPLGAPLPETEAGAIENPAEAPGTTLKAETPKIETPVAVAHELMKPLPFITLLPKTEEVSAEDLTETTDTAPETEFPAAVAAMAEEKDPHMAFKSIIQRFNKELEELAEITNTPVAEAPLQKATENKADIDLNNIDNLFDACETISPFEGESDTCWKYISFREAALLPLNTLDYERNTVVAAAWFRYGSLLLGKTKDGRYIFGAPGIYLPDDSKGYRSLGFYTFRGINGEAGPGATGYWLKELPARPIPICH